MSATPAIAILGLLARILEEIIKALKSSEEGVESVSSAFGVFAGIGDTITAVLQKVAEGIGWLAKQFVGLLEKLNLVNDKMRENQVIAAEEIRIAKEARDATMKNAEAQRDIAELRAKAVDKEKYSVQERIAFLEQASAKEEEVAARSRKAAKDEYELIKRRNALTKSSAEALKAEADAYARMVQADTNYQNAVRRNTREINAARKEAAREAKERLKERTDAEKARLEAEKEMLSLELSLLAEGTIERLNKQKELAAKEHEIAIANAQAKIKDKAELDKQLDLLESIHLADLERMDRAFEQKQISERLKAGENELAALEKNSEAYLQKAIELKQLQVDTLARMDGESDAEYQARVIAAQEGLKAARLDYQEWVQEQEAIEKENSLALLMEDQFQQMANEVALREWQLEKIREYGKKEEETEAEYRAREIAAEKAFYDAKRKQRTQWVQSMQAAAGAVSGILGSIADMYESNTDATQAEQEKAKNIRIAGATIDMLSGVVSAISTAQQLGPIAGPIMAALNSAAVIAAGVANISKIRATNVSKDSAGSSTPSVPASVDAPSVTPIVQEMRTITSASEEDRLNQMAGEQRVYILSSDLEADRESTRVRVQETDF